MEKEFKADLLEVVDLGPRHKVLTVRVYPPPSRWLHIKQPSYEKDFTYMEGIWLDGGRVVKSLGVRLRLSEMRLAHIESQKLDKFIATL